MFNDAPGCAGHEALITLFLGQVAITAYWRQGWRRRSHELRAQEREKPAFTKAA